MTYKTFDSKEYNKAGEYRLSKVILESYDGDQLDITSLILEINIYEDLFSNGLSGNLIISDAVDVPQTFPITGFEKIKFKLASPGLDDTKGRFYDFEIHPMYIYKISDRLEVTPKTQAYTLHFCSRELIRNQQVRVSKAFTGSSASMFAELMQNLLYIDCKKPLFIEIDAENWKYVIPNIHPFDAINRICKQTRPDDKNFGGKHPGYVFYETAAGYHFLSLESHLIEGPTRRLTEPYATFGSSVSNVNPATGKKYESVKAELGTIKEYKILSQFDTIKAIKAGVASSKLLTHDSFNKLFKDEGDPYDFSYHKDYEKWKHLEPQSTGKSKGMLLPLTSYDRGKMVSSMHDSVKYFKSSTEKIHNNVEPAPVEQVLQRRISYRNAFDMFRVEFEVPGYTGLHVGEVVKLHLKNRLDEDGNPTDNLLNGRYLVASIRHQISRSIEHHSMIIEAIKDSVDDTLPESMTDTFSNIEKNEKSKLIGKVT